MKNTPIHYGLLLAAITFILFFAVYFFFIGFNYYMVSIKVNVFGLPSIYTLMAVILLYKKSNIKKLSFAKSLQYSFTTMFIGGTVSYLLIAFFFNYVDKESQVLLRHQGLEQILQGLHAEYQSVEDPTEEQTLHYEEYAKSLTSELAKKEPLFNLKNSFIILSLLYLFYLIISVLLSIFFRTRIPHATLNNHPPAQ
ncbi:MAG: DUF4199 domain-containing protein [Flavobacteriaceae bacterium]|jgi:uncharacterized membrane protein YgaE (UPF0421/DUF939 family)|nr:DUF4199 domain-containing protein [Flavobacteriaceae bacterium]